MTQDNLSNACLKVNDIPLSQLCFAEGDIPHNSDIISLNKVITNAENDIIDSKLSLEEKFVHYCTICATSEVNFCNNDHSTDETLANEITSKFKICYKNNDKIIFDDVTETAKIDNINLSDTFCLDAIGYYNDVVQVPRNDILPRILLLYHKYDKGLQNFLDQLKHSSQSHRIYRPKMFSRQYLPYSICHFQHRQTDHECGYLLFLSLFFI